MIDVLNLVLPHMPRDPRLIIHQAEIGSFIDTTDTHWDDVWHDIWTNREAGEPHLDVAHLELMAKLRRRAKRQRAWNLSRWCQRRIDKIQSGRK